MPRGPFDWPPELVAAGVAGGLQARFEAEAPGVSDAHHGKIVAANLKPHGLAVTITLPIPDQR